VRGRSLGGVDEQTEQQLLSTRLQVLNDRLRHVGPLVVAFSGGADSAFLVAAATRANGAPSVVAVTAVSD
jgi:uncharacterized protein